MDINVEELMKCMLNLFNNTNKQLHDEYQKLKQKDLELSDLDHYVEFNKLKAYKHAKVSKLRQNIRLERREIKNTIYMIEIVKKFTDKYNSKLITGDIIQNLKEQNNLSKNQENAKYKYKTNILERLEATRNEQVQKQEDNN